MKYLLIVLLFISFTGCNTFQAEPTPTPMPTFTPIPTATFTPIPTATTIPTPTLHPLYGDYLIVPGDRIGKLYIGSDSGSLVKALGYPISKRQSNIESLNYNTVPTHEWIFNKSFLAWIDDDNSRCWGLLVKYNNPENKKLKLSIGVKAGMKLKEVKKIMEKNSFIDDETKIISEYKPSGGKGVSGSF